MSENSTPPPQEEVNKRTYSAWMGFAQREIRPGRSVRIRILWGRVAIFMAVLAMLGWFAKSWGLYIFFRNVRDFEDVSFSDMILFPLNRTNVRIQQGNYQIEQAQSAIEREDYRRAFMMLREGVTRSPGNQEGRMLLAQFYAGWRPDLAIELLVDGIDKGLKDPDYLRLTSNLLLSQKEDGKILELTGELLEEELPPEAQQILAVSRLQSAIYNGQFGIAREVFESAKLEKTIDGLILGTLIYTKIGRPEDAIGVLNAALQSIPPENASMVYQQLVGVYKQQEMYSEAREVALKQMIARPLEWRPRILLIDVLSASGLTERRDREINTLMREFREDEQAMLALGQLSAEYGNVQAASRLYEVALENGYSLSVFSLSLAEAFVQNGQHEEAIDLCNELIREDPAWMLRTEGSFNAIRSLAYFGYGDDELGSLYLKNFLESKQTNTPQMLQAARRFSEYGLQEQALRVLQEAHVREPNNELVLADLIEVEMDLAVFFNLEEHLRDLFILRRPNYELIENIQEKLRSDRFLFTRNRVELLDGLSDILAEREVIRDWEIWKMVTQTES